MTWTRRRFLTASGAAAVAAAWRAPARAQAPKPITVSHSVSTFVYGQHLGGPTPIGSGTYGDGVYVLKGLRAADGKAVNDHVESVSGGGPTTMLGGLKAAKFDAIMAVPEWQWAAEEEGFGKAIYDVQD